MDETSSPTEKKLSDSQLTDDDHQTPTALGSSDDDHAYPPYVRAEDSKENNRELDKHTSVPLSDDMDGRQTRDTSAYDTDAQHTEDSPNEVECADIDRSTEAETFFPKSEVLPKPEAPEDVTSERVADNEQCSPSTSPVDQTPAEPHSTTVEPKDEDQEYDNPGGASDAHSSEVIALPENEPNTQTASDQTVDDPEDAASPDITSLTSADEEDDMEPTEELDSDKQLQGELEPACQDEPSPSPVGLIESSTEDSTVLHPSEASVLTENVDEEKPVMMAREVSEPDRFEDVQGLPEITKYESITSTEHTSPSATSQGYAEARPTLVTEPEVLESVADQQQISALEIFALEEHGDSELANTVLTTSEAFENVPIDVVIEVNQGEGLLVSQATEHVTVNTSIMASDSGLPYESVLSSAGDEGAAEPEVTRENVEAQHAAVGYKQPDIASKQDLVVDTTEQPQPVYGNASLVNNASLSHLVKENGYQSEDSLAYAKAVGVHSSVSVKSRTLDARTAEQWGNTQLHYKVRAATLGPSGSRKRMALRPKPAINDDHLFPDSVTPTKVEPLLSARSVSMGLPDGTYDLPYMDDEAFLRKLRRGVHDTKNGLSDDESINGFMDEPYLCKNGYLDPEHLANTDECAATPLLTPKNKRIEEIKGKRQKWDKSNRRKMTCMPGLCGCISKRRSR